MLSTITGSGPSEASGLKGKIKLKPVRWMFGPLVGGRGGRWRRSNKSGNPTETERLQPLDRGENELKHHR